MKTSKAQDPDYAGKLTLWNNPALDALCEVGTDPRRRVLKPKVQFPELCPGCQKVVLLHKGFFATVCQECHDDIKERARRPL